MEKAELPLLAKHPILDKNMTVVGYELLARPLPEEGQTWQDAFGDQATSEVLISAYQELGINYTTGGLPAYVNFTRNWLHNPPVLSPSVLVIEILEHIDASEDNINAVKHLRSLNFTVALDDYLPGSHQDKWLPYVDIVKIDLLQLDDISSLEERIRPYRRPGLTWLAEKVETYEVFHLCQKAGCSLFQGYFFCKPALVYGRRVPDNEIAVLKLLDVLSNPDTEVDDTCDVLQADPQLSSRLMQLVNSPGIGRPVSITSIRHALVVLGNERVKSWARVLALGKLDKKPSVLREQAILRGFICQGIAQHKTELDAETAFTLGLFSLLDGFFNLTMTEVCQKLLMTPEMNDALLKHEGIYGMVLNIVCQIEQAQLKQCDWDSIEQWGIDINKMKTIYKRAAQDTQVLLSGAL